MLPESPQSDLLQQGLLDGDLKAIEKALAQGAKASHRGASGKTAWETMCTPSVLEAFSRQDHQADALRRAVFRLSQDGPADLAASISIFQTHRKALALSVAFRSAMEHSGHLLETNALVSHAIPLKGILFLEGMLSLNRMLFRSSIVDDAGLDSLSEQVVLTHKFPGSQAEEEMRLIGKTLAANAFLDSTEKLRLRSDLVEQAFHRAEALATTQSNQFVLRADQVPTRSSVTFASLEDRRRSRAPEPSPMVPRPPQP